MWEMLITFNKICLVLTYNAEWCPRKRGEEGGDGRRGKRLRQRHVPTRRPSPPVPSGGPHHSAANAVSKRNPLPIPAGPTIPQNFARKILRNPQPHLIAHPQKKNGPRGFPGTVDGCVLRLYLRLETFFVNRLKSSVLSLPS